MSLVKPMSCLVAYLTKYHIKFFKNSIHNKGGEGKKKLFALQQWNGFKRFKGNDFE